MSTKNLIRLRWFTYSSFIVLWCIAFYLVKTGNFHFFSGADWIVYYVTALAWATGGSIFLPVPWAPARDLRLNLALDAHLDAIMAADTYAEVVRAGRATTLLLDVTNAGNVALTNVVVTDPFDELVLAVDSIKAPPSDALHVIMGADLTLVEKLTGGA